MGGSSDSKAFAHQQYIVPFTARKTAFSGEVPSMVRAVVRSTSSSSSPSPMQPERGRQHQQAEQTCANDAVGRGFMLQRTVGSS